MKTERLSLKDCLPVTHKFFFIIALFFFTAGRAFALPDMPQTVSGLATFHTQGNNLTITSSPHAIINWKGFSIASHEAVRFIQQSSSSAVLNRVIGQDPSRIFGLLQSNGMVFLINPNGILFGRGSRIDVNGLAASTLNISNQDFLAGKYNFTAGGIAGSVQNQGTIATPAGGTVYLIAPDTENSGIIHSPQGEILLAAGRSVQLVDPMDPDIAVVVSSPESKAVNLGQIIAQSGKVGIYGGLIHQKGHVHADSAVVGENGRIFFKASQGITLDVGSTTSANGPQGGQISVHSQTGTSTVSGKITAVGNEGKGGNIQVLGNSIDLTGSLLVDASGTDGGGVVLIGGDFHGDNPAVQNAAAISADSNVVIRADALETGNGGKVALWSDDRTFFYGAISARGGAAGGDGGNVEVSGKQTLIYKGLTDLRAPQGKTGTLLLDPTNFYIDSEGDITGGELGEQLGQANVSIQTEAAGEQNGDIYVNDPVTWTTANTLTLSAHNDIWMENVIANNSGGNLVLRADSDGSGGGNVYFTGIGHVNLSGGGDASVFYNPSAGYSYPTDYTGHFTGVTPTAYMLVHDIDDFQAINTNLDGTYALSKDIDASITTTWNNGAGFVPLGDNSLAVGYSFNGIFYGQGHIITGLYIYRPSTQYVGPFGGTIGGMILDVGLENVNITGGFQTGGLVAHTGANVFSCYTTGSVSGSNNVGGLVGLSAGGIMNSFSTATVNGSTWVGGLAGTLYTGGSINNSYSAGAVHGSSQVGGLVGYNYGEGPILSSYWDTQTSGLVASDGGTGKTTAAMKQQATFTGWDFNYVWGIREGETYPFINAMASAPSPSEPPSPPPEPPSPPYQQSTDDAAGFGNYVASDETVVAMGIAEVNPLVSLFDQEFDGDMEEEFDEKLKKVKERGQGKTDVNTYRKKVKNYCN